MILLFLSYFQQYAYYNIKVSKGSFSACQNDEGWIRIIQKWNIPIYL